MVKQVSIPSPVTCTTMSPLTEFTEAIGRGSRDECRSAIESLPRAFRNRVYKGVWEEAGADLSAEDRWGELHAFDDLKRLERVLHRTLREFIEREPQKARNRIYGQVYDLASKEHGSEGGSFASDDPLWGEHHAFEDMTRLTIAVSREVGIFRSGVASIPRTSSAVAPAPTEFTTKAIADAIWQCTEDNPRLRHLTDERYFQQIFSRYNQLLKELGLSAEPIPLYQFYKSEAPILFPDLFYEALLESCSKDFIDSLLKTLNGKLQFSHLAAALESDKEKYGKKVLEEIAKRYNEILEENDLHRKTISLEDFAESRYPLTTIENPALFFLAYHETLSSIRRLQITLCAPILAKIKAGQEVYPISSTSALVYAKDTDEIQVLALSKSNDTVLSCHFCEITVPQPPSEAYLFKINDAKNKCLEAARKGLLRVTTGAPFRRYGLSSSIHIPGTEELQLALQPGSSLTNRAKASVKRPLEGLIALGNRIGELATEPKELFGAGATTRVKQRSPDYVQETVCPLLKAFLESISQMTAKEIDEVAKGLSPQTTNFLFYYFRINAALVSREDLPKSIEHLMKTIGVIGLTEEALDNKQLACIVSLCSLFKSIGQFDSSIKMLDTMLSASKADGRKLIVDLAKQCVTHGAAEYFNLLLSKFPFLIKELSLLDFCRSKGRDDFINEMIKAGCILKPLLPRLIDTILDPANGWSEAQRFERLSFLLKNGIKPDEKIHVNLIARSLLEHIFFYTKTGLAPSTRNGLIHILIKSGAKVPENILLSIKREPNKHTELLSILKESGIYTEEQIRSITAPRSDCPRDTLLDELSSSFHSLALLAQRYKSNPLERDFTSIEKLKELKKKAKLYLQKKPEDTAFKGIYDAFCIAYDAVVTNHTLLSLLRNSSRELRERLKDPKQQPSDMPMQLIGIWSEYKIKKLQQIHLEVCSLDKSELSALWGDVRRNCLSTVTSLGESGFWDGKRLVCIHGTKLMPGMLKAKALIPLGEMMEEGKDGAVVAHSGQQSGSVRAHNKHHISCSPLDAFTEITQAQYETLFGASSIASQSIVYASQEEGYGRVETVFDLETSKLRVQPEVVLATLKAETIDASKITPIHTDILRLRSFDPEHCKEYLDPLKDVLTHELSKVEEGTDIHAELTGLIKTLTMKIRFCELTAEDRALIERRLPVAFGTTTKPTVSYLAAREGKGKDRFFEVLIKGEAKFNDDLQVAFVKNEDLDDAASLLEPLGVKVFSFESLLALETESFARSQMALSLDRLTAATAAPASFHESLNAYMELEILPEYGRLFPEKPTFIDKTGEKHSLVTPQLGARGWTYEQYLKAAAECRIPPRRIHGKMHAVRTALASLILFEINRAIYSKLGKDLKVDRRLLALAAAAHDSQRQDEGKDHWDNESGKFFGSWLASKRGSEHDVELYRDAIADKDPEDGTFSSLEKQIIHDADVLEILRVINLDDFDRSRLVLFSMEEKGIETILEDVKKIIKEWKEFTDMTESADLRLHLEYSQNTHYYREVMNLLVYLVQTGRFPTLKSYMPADMFAEANQPSRQVLDILFPGSAAAKEHDEDERCVSPFNPDRGAGAGARG